MNGFHKEYGKYARDSSGTETITFGIPFNDSPSVVAIPNLNGGQGTIWNYFAWDITTTSFKFNNNGQPYHSWIAQGY